MKDLILLLLGFMFFTSALSAQDDNSLPSFLSDMAGEWEVTSFPDDLWTIKLTGSWEEVLGGRYLIGKFNGPSDLEHIAVTGYNTWLKTYFITVFSNDGGSQFHLDGVYNDSTRTISYKLYNVNGENLITNMIFTDRDNITWEMPPPEEKAGGFKFTRIK